ncbi:unnamed protein product [Anisakis simplex]|uniref:MFS transporter n=1 Tax=Anisakis simplex TaxID=6269 RepID=A0A0M3K9Y5_ANISI|nr:unnamed protein product [Anisakis simplex]
MKSLVPAKKRGLFAKLLVVHIVSIVVPKAQLVFLPRYLPLMFGRPQLEVDEWFGPLSTAGFVVGVLVGCMVLTYSQRKARTIAISMQVVTNFADVKVWRNYFRYFAIVVARIAVSRQCHDSSATKLIASTRLLQKCWAVSSHQLQADTLS